MVRPALLVVFLLAACSSAFLLTACSSAPVDIPREGSIHPKFSTLRPVMVAILVEAPTALAADLDAALRRELIELSYSPLAPGANRDDETGSLVVIATKERAEVAFSAADGTPLYRMNSDTNLDDPAALAKALLASLPPK